MPPPGISLRATETRKKEPWDEGDYANTVYWLQSRKRSLDWWTLPLVIFISSFFQGTFDDVKANYLQHVDRTFLTIMQGGLALFFIIWLWYISRQLAPINEALDASHHVEKQLSAIHLAHHTTQKDIMELKRLLGRIREVLPGAATAVMMED